MVWFFFLSVWCTLNILTLSISYIYHVYPHLVYPLAGCSKFLLRLLQLLRWELQLLKAATLLALARLSNND